MKPTRCTNFPNLLRHENLHVSGSPSLFTVHSKMLYVIQFCRQLSSRTRVVPLPIIRSLFTVHSTRVYIIQVCRQLSSWTRMELISILVLLESRLQTCMTYTSAKCTANKLLMIGRGTARNM
jgi:hypothetical protein